MTARLRLFRPWQLLMMTWAYGLLVGGAGFFLTVAAPALSRLGMIPSGAQFDLVVLIAAPLVAPLAVLLIAGRTCRELRDWFLFVLLVLVAATVLSVVIFWFGQGFLNLTDPGWPDA
jgi:hypothetical protein